jgi:SpoIIAA-like
MFSVTSAFGANLMILTLSGKVSGKEFSEICQLLRVALEKNKAVDLFCELEGFRGIGLTAMWRSALVATEKAIKLRRVAVVGERSRYKWARVLVRGFHAETRYFDPGHRTRALRWLEKGPAYEQPREHKLTGDAGYRIQPNGRKPTKRS